MQLITNIERLYDRELKDWLFSDDKWMNKANGACIGIFINVKNSVFRHFLIDKLTHPAMLKNGGLCQNLQYANGAEINSNRNLNIYHKKNLIFKTG